MKLTDLVLTSNDPRFRQCTLSLMDNIFDPDISFDSSGICNYFHEFKKVENKMLTGSVREEKFMSLIKEVKENGKGKRYDCIIGVSGGVDSSYLSLIAHQHDLRVLLVHFDNGWNSELAVDNINRIIKYTGFDLYTYVIDWSEFRDIQRAYFKAGVIDIESVTDIAIFHALDMICKEKGIPYILDGRNFATESIMPRFWVNKNPNNLYDIHKRFGEIKLNHYPVKFHNDVYHKRRGSFKNIPLLNYLEYNKAKVKNDLQEKMGWRDYGGKHYESVFTRFYQGYILPVKYNVDKRKAHLSNLIFSGQITKEEALREIELPIYEEKLLTQDLEFVPKKLGFSKNEFDEYMKRPPVLHSEYNNEYPAFRKYRGYYLLKKIKQFFKSK